MTVPALSPPLAPARRIVLPSRSWALSIGSVLLGILVWHLGALLIEDPVMLPTPVATAEVLIRYLHSPYPANGETLIGHALVSLGRVIAGFAIGSAIGIAIGALMAGFRSFHSMIDPFIEIYRDALHYRAMSMQRQLSLWAALGLWAAAVAGGAVYGAWHGDSGRPFVVALGVLAFFLAIQLLFAAGNLGERLGRRIGSQRGILLAIVPFLAYLIYLIGTNSFTWLRATIAITYVLTPVLLVISADNAKPGAWQDYLAMLAIFLPLKLRWLNILWPFLGAQIGYVATMLLAISVALATFLFQTSPHKV